MWRFRKLERSPIAGFALGSGSENGNPLTGEVLLPSPARWFALEAGGRRSLRMMKQSSVEVPVISSPVYVLPVVQLKDAGGGQSARAPAR